MTQVALCIHSRGRPIHLKRMIDNAIETSVDPTALQFFIALENDDPALVLYSQVKYDNTIYREYQICASGIGVDAAHKRLHAKAIRDPSVVAVILSYDYDTFESGWDRDLHTLRR